MRPREERAGRRLWEGRLGSDSPVFAGLGASPVCLQHPGDRPGRPWAGSDEDGQCVARGGREGSGIARGSSGVRS